MTKPFQKKVVMDLKSVPFNRLVEVADLHTAPLYHLTLKYLDYFTDGETEKSTYRCKKHDFAELLMFLGRGDPMRPVLADLTKAKVERFRDLRLEQGEAPSTINRRLATIKHFARTIAERVPSFFDDVRHVRPFLLDRSECKALPEVDAEKILTVENLSPDPFLNVRNRTMLIIGHATGVRASELVQIKMRHLNAQWVRGLVAKGRRVRDNIFLADEPYRALLIYIERRELEIVKRFPAYRDLDDDTRGRFPLFISFYRAKLSEPDSFGLSYEALRHVAKKAAEATGVPLNFHRFRHTAAKRVLEITGNIETVRRVLGLESLQQASRYAKSNDQDVQDVQQRRFAK